VSSRTHRYKHVCMHTRTHACMLPITVLLCNHPSAAKAMQSVSCAAHLSKAVRMFCQAVRSAGGHSSSPPAAAAACCSADSCSAWLTDTSRTTSLYTLEMSCMLVSAAPACTSWQDTQKQSCVMMTAGAGLRTTCQAGSVGWLCPRRWKPCCRQGRHLKSFSLLFACSQQFLASVSNVAVSS
jgi:hypothetical protein